MTTNNTSNKVTLYIFTHNKTGLKYFGKTKRYFDEISLLKYGGSGTYWNEHLKKHGKDLSVKIYGIFNLYEVKEIALKFSEDNDIVKSINESGNRKGKKVWANEKPENGLDGGWSGLETHRKLLSEKMIKQNKDPETREKFSLAKKGSKSPTALKINIFNNNNELMFECNGNFNKVCKENNLPFSALRTSYRTNIKIFFTNKAEKEAITRNEIHFKGWYAIKDKK